MTKSSIAFRFTVAWLAGLAVGGGIGFLIGSGIALHDFNGVFGALFGALGAMCGTFAGPLVWLLRRETN